MHLLHPAHISSWFLAATLALSSCASLPKDFDKPESFALSESQTDNTTLGRRAQELEARGGGGGKSGLRLLASGHDAFAARAALIQQAERSIDAQYYIMHNDLTGRLFAYQLLKAADRGVRVRLLLDDMGSDLGDEMASTLDSHPNMEVRYLNPFVRGSSKMLQVITDFNRVTRRMHNKSFTADSQISILGGRNIGDEYFGANEELDFGDLDTLVVGPAVAEVNESFDNYWNSELSYPVIALHEKTPSEQELSSLRNTLAADRPRVIRSVAKRETAQIVE